MDTIKTKINELEKITDNKICDNCLGRKFSNIIPGEDNKTRGEELKKQYKIKNLETTETCYICENILPNLKKYQIIEKIEETINKKELEFNTFLIGTKIPENIIEKDKQINKDLNLNVELIKKELNRIIGKELNKKIKKEAEFDNPDVVIMVKIKKPYKIKVQIQNNPLFIEGRYNKYQRGIPQTKWPCRKCRGKGCEECNGTGKQYQESVEELISEYVLEKFKGKESKFHGAGREDIDVRMLGTGRPFVLEIKEPKLRNLNLEEIEKTINEKNKDKTKYTNLKYTKRNRKAEIKQTSPNTYKIYNAIIKCEKPITPQDLEKLQYLHIIKQRTPTRVAHRRADKIREKEIKNIETKIINDTKFEMKIKTEGGLYIKELISGDNERSKPSISEILNNKSICEFLDVIEVGSK